MQEVNEFVIFSLDNQEYGIYIKNVRTIEKPGKMTRVPKSPKFVDGVINLRGEIIPVVDSRKLLGFQYKEIDAATRVIIVEVDDYLIGMIVDKVYDVQTIKSDNIDNSQKFINDFDNIYIQGIANVDGRLITILGLEKIFITN